MSNNSTGYFPLTKIFESDTSAGLEEQINSWLVIYGNEYKPDDIEIKYDVCGVYDVNQDAIAYIYSALLKFKFYNKTSLDRLKNVAGGATDGGFMYAGNLFVPPTP